jgi:prolyl-tRNA synthetase
MMRDTRALQSGTSHYFGQNFSKAFNIQFVNQGNELEYAYTTSWGLSTRMVGASIMTHGDDQGLIMPPRLAPIQVVIVPIFKDDAEKSKVMEVVNRLRSELSAFRLRVDERDGLTPGFKFNDWEMRGVPLRIEVGPKDVEKGSVALARRDRPGKAGKSFVPQAGLDKVVEETLKDIQTSLLARATAFRDEHIIEVKDYGELVEAVKDGWAFAWWCGNAACEAKVKEDTKASSRCIPIDQPGGTGRCVVCDAPASEKIYFAKAY